MELIIELVIKWAVPLILGTVVGFLSTKVKNYSKKDKAIEEGVQALLRNELIRRYREYEEKGEISILDKENMEAMFKQYEKLRWKWDSKENVYRIIRTADQNNKIERRKILWI